MQSYASGRGRKDAQGDSEVIWSGDSTEVLSLRLGAARFTAVEAEGTLQSAHLISRVQAHGV